MTPIFCCGFECGVTAAHWNRGLSGDFSTATTRSGSRSFRINPTAVNTGFGVSVALTTSSTYVARCYLQFSSLPNADFGIFGVGTSSTTTIGAIFKQSDSKIYAGHMISGTPTFGATGVSVTTGVWYLIDIKVISTSNPWTIDVKVNDTDCGQATRAVAGANVTNIVLGHTVTMTTDLFLDDILASVTSGDYPLGAGYVNHFVPTADGTHNIAGTGDFQRTLTGTDILNATTTAFQLVDEIPFEATVTDWINMVAPPNATDYVECIFGPAPGISVPTVAPRTVEVICGINQAGTGNGNMEIRLNDQGTTGVVYTATGVAGVAVATGQVFKRAHFSDPPSAASAWTLTGNGNFNDVRIRFGSPAAVDANPDQYFGCAMIEAEFAPAVAQIPNKIHQCNQAINRASTY